MQSAQSKYFICTLGTSIASSSKDLAGALREKQSQPGRWEDVDPAFEKALGNHVAATLKDGVKFHSSCAEASILRMANAAPGDRVVLLSTDTGLARMCGVAVKRLIVSGFGLDDSSVELVRVEGLQVADPERLRKVGLSSFVKTVVSRITENRYIAEIFLCPVGGYKGVVPFLTALGMAFHLPVLYTFERIDKLVRLPPLPFSLDRELYSRAKDALLELGRQCEMYESDFLNRIKGYQPEERDLFLSFVEPSGNPGFVTSTAFTEIFAPGFECSSAPVSHDAIDDLDLLRHGQDYRTACKMVIQSQDRLIREQWMHPKVVATDLQILKQGNTNIRILGFESGGRFNVCRVLAHDAYDRLLSGKNCPKVASFRNQEFTNWEEPPEILPDSVKDAESPFEAAMRMIAEFDSKLRNTVSHWATRVNEVKHERDSEVGKLASELAAAEKGHLRVQNRLDKTKTELQNSQREAAALAEQINNKDAENFELKGKIQEQSERIEASLREINDLRRRLREAQTRLAMAPSDTEVLKRAEKDISERKAQIEQAFQSLLMSDKTEIPQKPSEELAALQKELRISNAQLLSKAEEVRRLEQENASLVEALRQTRIKLAVNADNGFWNKLARFFFRRKM